MCARRNRGMAPNGMRPNYANSRRCVRCCVRARDGGEGDASGRARGLMDARVCLQVSPAVPSREVWLGPLLTNQQVDFVC